MCVRQSTLTFAAVLRRGLRLRLKRTHVAHVEPRYNHDSGARHMSDEYVRGQIEFG
jgi:hypothetical protein